MSMSKEYCGILVLAEQKNGGIHKISYELLGKAVELGEKLGVEVYCALLGPEDLNAKELIYRGADKVFYYQDDQFDQPEELIFKLNLEQLIMEIKPEICLIGATSLGRSIAPRLAAALGTGLTADCTGLEIDEDGRLIQIRPAFSENILAYIKTDTYPQMATVRYKEFDEAVRDERRKGQIIHKAVVKPENAWVKVLKEVVEKNVCISDAQVVVGVGRGLKKVEDLKMIQELADVLGGTVGASRAVVDEGLIGKEFQVGYSGNRVKPQVYIACGISGAPQHVAGMKESSVIIAINSDPSAPIFNVADYGIVDDMYKVIPEFIAKIKENNQFSFK